MKTTIQITDFNFKFAGYGRYQVTYTNPNTGKEWIKTITDMPLIDATKNADEPKKRDLNALKSLIKN